MSELEDLLRAEIRRRNAIPFDAFMALTLYHPQYGYYTTHDPLNDFATAPEISQLFGEMIALWCVDVWLKLGSPSSFTLLECGPGRGTLMADILRTVQVVPAFLAAAKITLLEKSPLLKEKQREKLAGYDITWLDDVAVLPKQPTIMLCNEFFDAFPIRRFMKTESGWKEQAIAMNGNGFENGFEYVLVDCHDLPEALQAEEIFRNAPLLAVTEFCTAAQAWMETFSAHLREEGGAALIIDYGYEGPALMDSVQAIHDKKMSPVLAHIGKTDITGHVDFTALASLAKHQGLSVFPITTQHDFLTQCGILQRAIMLKRVASIEQQKRIDESLHRLIGPDRMGHLFRVMSFASAGVPTPLSFANAGLIKSNAS